MSKPAKRKSQTPQQALERLEALCARAEQCSFDLRRKLAAWGISADNADKIVTSLKKRRFVDDSRYAHIYVRDKYRFNRWGRAKIRLGLMSKRIDSATIADALSEIDEEVYIESLRTVLLSKIRALGPDVAATYNGRTKLYRYGASRGFEPTLVAKLIREPSLWGLQQ